MAVSLHILLIQHIELTSLKLINNIDRRLAVAQTSSEYVLQQCHLLCYESEPIP